MFVFLSEIIMFYVLQTIMLFLKESNIKIKIGVNNMGLFSYIGNKIKQAPYILH